MRRSDGSGVRGSAYMRAAMRSRSGRAAQKLAHGCITTQRSHGCHVSPTRREDTGRHNGGQPRKSKGDCNACARAKQTVRGMHAVRGPYAVAA